MKLHIAKSAGKFMFTGYGNHYIAVNNERYERALIVTPDELYTDWDATRFDALNAAHIRAVLALQPELIVLGTGAVQRFPPPQLMREFAAVQVGVEVMDTRAACRTYNILMAEGRKVAAAILLE